MPRLVHYPDDCHPNNKRAMIRMCAAAGIEYEATNDRQRLQRADYEYAWLPMFWISPDEFPLNVKILYGPHFFIFPEGSLLGPRNPEWAKRAVYIALSDWVLNLYNEFVKETVIPFAVLPFGINPAIEDVKPNLKLIDCIIYFKRRNPAHLQYAKQVLESKGMTYRVFQYGSYSNDEYMRALKETKFVLWIGTHESQGFAFQDCLASNVPILVWDVMSMFDEWNMYERYRGQKNLYATTASQWSSTCGERIICEYELSNAIVNILTNIDKYTPREYILSRLSDTIAIKRILDYFVPTHNFKGRITILGSCRQDSLKDHYDVTSIQERLTYPHYTKEIIQTIEYCKGISKFDNKLTKYGFRTGILDKKEILYQKELQEEFQSTDLFVVEIASRISYEWNSMYVHHILAEEQYGFHDILNISQRDLSDEEIEYDILKMKEYLFPKKFIIVSHIATRKSGKRYELVNLLESICYKHNIPFINPAQEISNLPDLYENDTAFHYTRRGHEEICKVYNRHIQSVFNKKTIVFIWKQSFNNFPRTKTKCFWGLGDMIRGLVGAYRISKKYNLNFIVDISLHPISMVLETNKHEYSDIVQKEAYNIPYYMPDDVEYYVYNHLVKKSEKNYLMFFSNMGLEVFQNELEPDIKRLIQQLLTPREGFRHYAKYIFKSIFDNNHSVIHYRLGDDELVCGKTDSINYENVYQHLVHHYKDGDIVLTDSQIFKNIIKERNNNIQLLDTKICHVSHEESYIAIRDTMVEFFIIMLSKQIKSFSIYEHISGFVFAVHKIFGTPLEGNSNVRF